MSEIPDKICIYPGCERPAAPAHPQGGPQPAFCDLEEHNALTAHQERQRLASLANPEHEEEPVVANEAYRAVFLRVHPTGKMVLSLTTDSDGKEPQYAQLVADELGVPALDVKVVPADTDRFGVGHGYNTSPSDGRLRGDRQGHGEDPRQGAAARGHGAGGRAGDADVVERRLGQRRRQRPDPASRRSRTSPCTPTAPARCRRASRAGSTRRPSTGLIEPAGARRSRPRPRRRP